MIPLVLDVPLEVDPDELELGGWDRGTAESTFERYEMKTVWQRLVELLDAGALGDAAPGSAAAGPPSSRSAEGVIADAAAAHPAPPEATPPAFELREVALPASVAEVTNQLNELGAGSVAVAARWDGIPGRGELVGLLLLATEGDEAGFGVMVPADLLTASSVVKKLNAVLGRRVLGHDVKEAMRSLLPLGIDLTGLEMDTAVAAYLLDASTGEYELQQLREQSGQLSLEILEPGETAAELAREAAGEAADVAGMAASFRQRLRSEDMAMLHDDIETPLVRVLAKMEVAGIGIDRVELQAIADSLKESVATLQGEVHRHAGHEFNVNSTPQLRAVLYDELGLTPGKKTKTGFSTDAQTLESLRDAHPIVDALLDYREVEKLRSTYGESLLAEVQADGRIHASFGQTVARTGRISSDRPNLHNIPVRTELGKQFRRAFVPAAGSSFLVADYDQVELRCIAHLSEDPGLIDALTSGADVHRTVAAAVYGIPPEEVTHTQREFSKMVSYGLAYGMEAYGLTPTARRPRRGGGRHHGELLRRLPAREALHGHHGGRGRDPRRHAHDVRTGPAAAGPARRQLPDPPGGRAPGHERGHPGPGGGHLQARAGPARSRSRGRASGQPPRAPGARRGDRRGRSGGGGGRAPPHRVRTHRGGGPPGPPRPSRWQPDRAGRRPRVEAQGWAKPRRGKSPPEQLVS